MTSIVPSLPLIRVNGGVQTDEDFDQLSLTFTGTDGATPVSIAGLTFTAKIGAFATAATGAGTLVISGTGTNVLTFNILAAAKRTWPVGTWPITLLATDGTYSQDVFAPNSTIQVGGAASWIAAGVRFTSILTQQTFLAEGNNLPAGITITDGTNTVAGATQITVGGAVVGGAPPNATLSIPRLNAAVTPYAGGGPNGAQLSAGVTFVNEPATNGDSLQLPNAVAGISLRLFRNPEGSPSSNSPVYVKNGSGDTILGFSDSIDWSNTTSGGLPAPALEFWCIVNGNWFTNGFLD